MWNDMPAPVRRALLSELRTLRRLVVTGCDAAAPGVLAAALAARGHAVTTWTPGAPIDPRAPEVLLVGRLEDLKHADRDQGPLLSRVMDALGPTVICLACTDKDLVGAPEDGVFRIAGDARIRVDLHARLAYPPPLPLAVATEVLGDIFG